MSRLVSGWSAIRGAALLVYLFLFSPIVVVVLLAFNPQEYGSFPMRGVSLRWFAGLAENQPILDAVKTSLLLGACVTVVSTSVGLAAAMALVRFDFPGKRAIAVLLTAPILMPQVVLGVAVLLFLRAAGFATSFGVLVVGHVMITLPYVILVIQARLYAIPRVYEDAAMTLGASPWHAFKDVTLPLLGPAVLAAALFAFTISFDDVTATLFWKPVGIETVPTLILAMLQLSVSQQVNALGTALIVFNVAIPLLAMAASRAIARRGLKAEGLR